MFKIVDENDISIKNIEKNWRYRVLRYENDMYLLDISTYWLSLIFFPIVWFLPINSFKIDESVAEKLGEKTIKSFNKSSGTVLLIILLSMALANVIDGIINKLNLTKEVNILYVYMIPAITLLYYSVSRNIKKKKILGLINKENNEKQFKIELSRKVRKKLKPLIFIIGIFLVLFLEGILFFGKNIIMGNPDAKDYLGYFLIFFCWNGLAMYNGIAKQHLVGATITVKDK